MLSAAKYPYMNRAYRRNPSSYAAGMGAVALAGSALLLALLRHVGILPALAAPAVEQRPNPVVAAIRNRGKSVVNKLMGLWRKLTS